MSNDENSLKSTLIKKDLFRPEFLLLAYTIFLILAAISFKINLPMKTASSLSIIFPFLTFPFFIIGVKSAQVVFNKRVGDFLYILFSIFIIILYTGISKSYFDISLLKTILFFTLPIGAVCVLIYSHSKELREHVSLRELFIVLGLIFFFVSLIRIGGIPLLNPALKIELLHSITWGFAVIFFTMGYALYLTEIKNRHLLFIFILLSTLLFSLSAFRTVILLVFLIGIISVYYNSKAINLKWLFLSLVSSFAIIVVIGYIALPLLDPIKLLFFRIGTTHLVFERILDISYPFGNTFGSLFFSGDPRFFVGSFVMGKANTNLTYTLLGEATLDFGIAGAFLWMYILGMVLGLAYLTMKNKQMRGFYPLLLAMSLIWIEAGVDPLDLVFFAFFLLFYMRSNEPARTYHNYP